jgi:hypothetical protein
MGFVGMGKLSEMKLLRQSKARYGDRLPIILFRVIDQNLELRLCYAMLSNSDCAGLQM